MSRALAIVLVAASTIVPLLYRTGWSDVFAALKLGALWAVFGTCLLLLVVLVLCRGAQALTMDGPMLANVALIAWIGCNLVAFACSIDRHQSLFGERYWYQGLLTVLLYAGFFLVARVAFNTPDRLWWLAAGVAAGGTLVGIVGIMQQMGADPVFGIAPSEGRVFSTIGQPNSLAAYLVLTIATAAAFLARPEPAVRAMAVVAIGVMSTTLILTGSRGGYAGLIVGAVFAAIGLVWVSGARPVHVLEGLMLVALLGLGSYLTVAPIRTGVDRSWERTFASSTTRKGISNGFHLDLWHEGWRVSVDNPLLGTGQETFPLIFPDYARDLPDRTERALNKFRIESPHNVYLAITAGTGFPALASYLTLVASFVVCVLRAARRAVSRVTKTILVMFVAAISGHLVTDVFMTADLTTAWLTWLLMGAGLSAASNL